MLKVSFTSRRAVIALVALLSAAQANSDPQNQATEAYWKKEQDHAHQLGNKSMDMMQTIFQEGMKQGSLDAEAKRERAAKVTEAQQDVDPEERIERLNKTLARLEKKATKIDKKITVVERKRSNATDADLRMSYDEQLEELRDQKEDVDSKVEDIEDQITELEGR